MTGTDSMFSKAEVGRFVLGLLSGVLLALFGVWIVSKSPHLTYSVNSEPLVISETADGGITVTITNDGNDVAENVQCHIKNTKIDKLFTQPRELHADEGFDSDWGESRVESLNPGETMNVTIYFKKDSPRFTPDKISVRAKRAVGELPKPKQNTDLGNWLLGAVVLLLILAKMKG